LGPRLALASLAALLIVVPFTLLLVLVENKWAPLARVDADAAATLTDWATRHHLDHFLEVVQSVSQPRWFQVAVAVMALWFLVKGAHRLALWAAVTMTVGGLLGVLLKQLVSRARPVIDQPIVHIGGYSFPSGRALNSMLGVLVGFDRIALGAHYVSDVLAGWIVALAVLAATTAAFATWRSQFGRRPTKLSEEGVDPEAAQATTNDSDVNPDNARTSTKRT
jgi:undecaprenyl-diphosphatase